MFHSISRRKSRELSESHGEPQFSEGRGHRFESCRVRQFLRQFTPHWDLDRIASVWFVQTQIRGTPAQEPAFVGSGVCLRCWRCFRLR